MTNLAFLYAAVKQELDLFFCIHVCSIIMNPAPQYLSTHYKIRETFVVPIFLKLIQKAQTYIPILLKSVL